MLLLCVVLIISLQSLPTTSTNVKSAIATDPQKEQQILKWMTLKQQYGGKAASPFHKIDQEPDNLSKNEVQRKRSEKKSEEPDVYTMSTDQEDSDNLQENEGIPVAPNADEQVVTAEKWGDSGDSSIDADQALIQRYRYFEEQAVHKGLPGRHLEARPNDEVKIEFGDRSKDDTGQSQEKTPAKESLAFKANVGDPSLVKQTIQGEMKQNFNTETRLRNVSDRMKSKMREKMRKWKEMLKGTIDEEMVGEKVIAGDLGEMEEGIEEPEKVMSSKTGEEAQGERITAGDQGEMKERMRERAKVNGDSIEMVKQGERMFMGREGKMKERMRERGKVLGDKKEIEKQSERLVVGKEGEMKERMKETGKAVGDGKEIEKQGERMILGDKSVTKERMRERERVAGNRKEGERNSERIVKWKNRSMRDKANEKAMSDKDQAVLRSEELKEEWLPGWIVNEKSKSKKEEKKMGNVSYVEVEKQKELGEHRMSSA